MEVDISGAKVFFTTPIDVPLLGKLQISETLIVSWIVMALITGVCFWLTRGLKVRDISKKQAVAEWIVETADKFVLGNMGEKFRYLIPFVSALFATSVVSNLISLIGLRSPTAAAQTVLPDEGYNCLSAVTVEKIPYVEAENAAGGITVTIG